MNNGKFDHEEIMSGLEEIVKEDIDHRTGKIFGYTYSAGNDVSNIVEKAFTRYMNENALDAFAFPGTKNLEKEVIRQTISILNGTSTTEGVFTAGGTESLLMAHRSARELFKEKKIKKVLIPVTAHPASLKACDYLGLTPVVLPVNQNFRLTKEIVSKHLDADVISVVASAPSYGVGVIDDIEEIGSLLEGTGVQFIVDACMGGMVLPFSEVETLWDFRVPGVTAICLDYHKFGYSAKGSSAVLYRDGKKMKELQAYTCSNWMGYSIVNTTMLNTKSGGPVAATWAVMSYLGKDGYSDIVSSVLEGCEYIKKEISENVDGLYILGSPETNLISFFSDKVDIFSLAKKMKDLGWYLQIQYEYTQFGVTMPANIHLTVGKDNLPHLENFIKDLIVCVKELEENPIKEIYNNTMNNIPYELRDNKLKSKVLDQYLVNS